MRERSPGSVRPGWALLVLWAAVLACGWAADAPALPRLSRDATILAFGDSLTFGTGAARSESYPAVLERLTGREVINAGLAGELAAEGLLRLPRLLDEHAPDLLILCHAGNDLIRRRNPENTEASLRKMIGAARERGIPVLLIGVPAPGIFLSSARVYENLASELDVAFDGDVLPDILSDPSLKSDPIHPNAEGYRRMAERLFERLTELGAL